MSEKKSNKKIKIAGIILVLSAAISVIVYVMTGNYETTDNAQLDADIIPIRSSISGYIQSVHFKDNQIVKKGDLLFTIDDTEFRTRVAQAEAALANAKSNLLAVKSNAKASEFNADAAFLSSESTNTSIGAAKARLQKVQSDYSRVKNMYEAKAATQAEWDAIKAELEVVKAQYNSALKQYETSTKQSAGVRSQAEAQQAMISLAEAMVRQREAELTLAKTQLEYTTIEAPFSGIVSKRSVEAGQFISAGSPLCSQIDKSSLSVAANFKETQISHIKVGSPVEIYIDAYPDMVLHGEVTSYIGATGAKFALLPPDNATGNFVKIVQRVPVKISIDKLSKDQIDQLIPGLSAFVKVKIKE